LFTNGLIVGEIIGSGATTPLMLSFLGRSAWAATFVFWSLPVAAILTFWLLLAPPAPPTAWPAPAVEAAPSAAVAGKRIPARVSPLHLGFMVGMASLVFFGMNAWIATYNQVIGQKALTSPALAALNGAQLPVTLIMIAFAQHLAGRRWPFIAGG